MPVYEYICEKCAERFERFVHKSDAEVKCVKCGSEDIRKLFSVFGLKLGGGSSASGGG